MARQFSIQNVLRQVSHQHTRELLARLGHGALDVPWADLTERDVEPVFRALRGLSANRYDEVEGACRTVFDLACETGIAALMEAAACLDDALLMAGLAGLPDEAGVYDQAAWACAHCPAVVELATLIHQVENLHWWRRRNDLPRRAPDASPEALKRLAGELSALLESEQGRGRKCTVETLGRIGTTYYFAYPDDYVQNVTAHDDHGQLTPRTFRRTFSVVFAYDQGEGALELYAPKLSPRLKQRMEVVFARAALGHELGPWAKPTYALDALKCRGPLATDPADRVAASVRQLRFRLRGTHRQLMVRGDPDRGPEDVYDTMDEVLDKHRVPLSDLEVTLATLCFEFLDAPRGRGRTMTFEVAAPNTCSLRNQRQDRIDLAVRYLREWGIYVRRPDAGLAAAG